MNMQKFMKAMTAIMLMIAMLCATGCKKADDPNNGGNNNSGNNSGGGNNGGGNNGGNNGGGTAEGMYVGVIGFNEALYTKQISLLNNSTEGSFLNFIEGLTMCDATALYHADNTALNWLQEATLPDDLINVSLVTFTDGLDNASIVLDNNYNSQAEFLNAINNRIMNDRVQGKSINAYAIGMKGTDVVDEEGFRQNLRKLSSNQSNVFEVENMDEATERFSEIASQLYNESTTFGLSVKIPGGYDNNTVVRITFDNVSEANSSSRYIQATYSREGGNGKLSDISYNGLQSTSGTSVISDRQDGLCYWYTFIELRTLDNELVTDLTHTKLWRMVGSTAEWQPESEFTPSNYSDIIVDRKSAVTVLVLDCTTSLGEQDFRKMKDAAKEFIRVLNDNGGGSGGNTLPTVVTNEVTDITPTTAVCGGKVTSNGGAAVIERGICWGTSHNPTTSDSHASNGTGTGSYTCNMTGLSAGTTYYVRAYAVNSHGTSYGDEVSFTTIANYTISISANPSNSGTVSGGGTYLQGQSCTVSATAATGYTFLRWKENSNQVSVNPNYTFTVNSDRTLVAQFQAQSYMISVSANPTSGGSVDGGGTYYYGQTCTVTATANLGYLFVAWTENGNQVSTNASYTFNVTDNHNLVAQFQQQTFTINVSANPSTGGVVAGGGSYNYGQSCTVSAVSNEGYYFVNWTKNEISVSTDENYTFAVTVDRDLVANFYHDGSTPEGYVDLGLPSGLLWATRNVGANTPEEYGDYFAWGETQSKSYFGWDNYQYCCIVGGNINVKFSKYCNSSDYGCNGYYDNLTTLLPEDDAATTNMGSDWRMPTKDEWLELYNNTTLSWTSHNGVRGHRFTGSNGNSLFLPAAGSIWSNEVFSVGEIAYYWSSSLYIGYNTGPGQAYRTVISGWACAPCSRDSGQPIRAVRSSRDK